MMEGREGVVVAVWLWGDKRGHGGEGRLQREVRQLDDGEPGLKSRDY